jgi:acyl transferase domain-containing protein
MELPTYPFQRERYWMDFEPKQDLTSGIESGHPLLGARLATALPIFQNQLSGTNPSYLADHRIHNMTILPASAYIEIALAAKNTLDSEQYSLEDISIREALAFSENKSFTTQLVLTPAADGTSFQFFSRESGAQPETWRLHTEGKIRTAPGEEASHHFSLDELRTRISHSLPIEAYYEHLTAVGADYGFAFRGLVDIHRAEGEALGKIELPAPLDEESEQYIIHPALLDACFQLLGATLYGGTDDPDNARVYVPVGIQKVQIHGRIGPSVHCYVKLRPTSQANSKNLIGDFTLFNEAKTVVAEVNCSK